VALTELTMSKLRLLAALCVPAVLLTGCPDAEGNYDDFKSRYSKVDHGDGGATCPDDPCTALPQTGELDGQYLFVLSASLDFTKPLMFAATITTAAGANGTEMTWKLEPLLWSDRKTVVGAAIDLDPMPIDAEGLINADLPPIDLLGDANPFSHSPITADVNNLKGRFCSGETFFFGTFDGDVTKPIPLSLAGSNWTLTKVTSPADYPEPPPIDCVQTPAAPVGTLQ